MSITKDVAVRLHLSGADEVKAQLTSVTEQADRLKTKTATLTIDARDEEWQVDAARVLQEAKELGATKVRIDVTADTEHARASLDLVRAKADELGLKRVNIKVHVDDAAALAKMGLLSRLAGGFGGGGIGGGEGLGAMPVLAGLGLPLLPGLLAGGAGLGLLGLPLLGAMLNAQAAANSPTKKGKHTVSEIADIKEFTDAIKTAEKTFEHWSGVVGKPIFKILEQGLKLVGPLLNDITPVIKAMEPILAKMISWLGKSISGGAIKEFFDWVAKNGPSAASMMLQLVGAVLKLVAVFVQGIGMQNSLNMFKGFLTIITALTPVVAILARVFGDVMGFIFGNRLAMIAFGAVLAYLGGPVTIVIGVIIALGAAVSWLTQHFSTIKRIALDVWHAIAGAVSSAFDRVKGVLSGGLSILGGIGRAMGSVFGTVGRVLGDVGHDAALLWDAITQGGAALSRVDSGVQKFGASVRKVVGEAVHDVGQWATDAGHAMVSAGAAIVHFAGLATTWLGHVVTRAVDDAGSFLARLPGMALHAMEGFLSWIVSTGAKAVAWFLALPGKVGHALADLPGQLMHIGAMVIEGLIHGIESGISNLLGTIGHVASIVTSGLKGLLGIHSPSAVTHWLGEMTGEGFGLGLESKFDRIRSAASGVAGITAGVISGSRFSLGGGAPGSVNVVIGNGSSGSRLIAALVNELRSDIRINFGGDVQRWATGR